MIDKKKQEIEKIKDQLKVMKKAQIIIYAILDHFDKAVKIAL